MKHIISIDGSYGSTGLGAAVVVLFQDDVEIKRWSRTVQDHPSRNYGLELMAAMTAMNIIRTHNLKDVEIVYDLEAIGKFALGDWKGNKKTSKESIMYRDFAIQFMKDCPTTILTWTRGHIGNIYNETADEYAKSITKI